MKYFITPTICGVILAFSSLHAIELSVIGGGNQQIWYQDSVENINNKAEGFGYHGGVLIEMYLGSFGVETGILYQHNDYTRLGPYNRHTDWAFNNRLVPILAKYRLDETPTIKLSIGIGPVFIHNILGLKTDFQGYWGEAPLEIVGNYVGIQLKGNVDIKLTPKLWLKPALTAQFNLKPYDFSSEEVIKGQEWTAYLSLGLALKL